MDALSDVLSAVRLDGAVYVNAEFTAPWCVVTQYGLHSAAPKLPDTDHVVFFHLLTEGSCLARLAGGTEEIRVEAGDLLLLAHDDLHVLGSDLNLQFGGASGITGTPPFLAETPEGRFPRYGRRLCRSFAGALAKNC